jgi:hypothetical protein
MYLRCRCRCSPVSLLHPFIFPATRSSRIRDPLPINVNPCFVLEDDPTPSRHSQIARATSLILASLKFCVSIRQVCSCICITRLFTLTVSTRKR